MFKHKVLSETTAYWLKIIAFMIAVYVSALYTIIPCKSLPRSSDVVTTSYSVFEESIENGVVTDAYYTESYTYIYYKLADSSDIYNTFNPKSDTMTELLVTHDIVVHSTADLKFAENTEDTRKTYVVVFLIAFSAFAFYKYYKLFPNKLVLAQPDGDTEVADKSKGKVKRVKTGKTFADIAGHYEVKKDLKSLVDFLVNKDKYIEAGAKLPKGALFFGPPGTGKTTLAKAVAEEANASFISICGSDFVEKYVGVGAKRVRETFADARKVSPCIVFIDEIDSIAGKRSSDTNSEDVKALNALLNEMDGFTESDNIIVLAATNRIDSLDPALLREGRFTNKYCINIPETAKERREVLDIYARNKKLGDDVNLDDIAKETVGFSQAKLESLMNESAIISVQHDSPYIMKKHIDEAMYKILLRGHQKEDQSGRSKEELEIVAWHEAGHALLGYMFGKIVSKVTILSSTSGAGGVTFSSPTKSHLLNITDLKHEIMELYGGREAERILLGDDSLVTTGASNDVERATQIINGIVTEYAMLPEFGLLTLGADTIDKEFVLKEKIKLSKEADEEAYKLLKENYDKLKQIAEALIEKETIYEKDLDVIFGK
jgi:cell division protease FtsH